MNLGTLNSHFGKITLFRILTVTAVVTCSACRSLVTTALPNISRIETLAQSPQLPSDARNDLEKRFSSGRQSQIVNGYRVTATLLEYYGAIYLSTLLGWLADGEHPENLVLMSLDSRRYDNSASNTLYLDVEITQIDTRNVGRYVALRTDIPVRIHSASSSGTRTATNTVIVKNDEDKILSPLNPQWRGGYLFDIATNYTQDITCTIDCGTELGQVEFRWKRAPRHTTYPYSVRWFRRTIRSRTPIWIL